MYLKEVIVLESKSIVVIDCSSSLNSLAVYIASPLCQRHIKESLYFYRRYEIATIEVPHHKSATCTLHIAIDRANNDQKVALKFMAIKVRHELIDC